MTLNISYHSQLWISLITSLTLKTLSLTYSTRCLPTSSLLILLKLRFSYLVYHNNSLYSIILLFIYLTVSYSHHQVILLAILVSSLIKICHSHNTISAVSKSCFLNIRYQIRIRNTIDQTILSTILLVATSPIHLKIVYCNSLLLFYTCISNESSSTCHELCCSCCLKNSFHHINPILKSLLLVLYVIIIIETLPRPPMKTVRRAATAVEQTTEFRRRPSRPAS